MDINKLLNSFKEYLLKSNLKSNIAKIIVFGSHAKGEATSELDKVIGRNLNTALAVRNLARYKPDALLKKEDAETVLDLAERLIKIVSGKL